MTRLEALKNISNFVAMVTLSSPRTFFIKQLYTGTSHDNHYTYAYLKFIDKSLLKKNAHVDKYSKLPCQGPGDKSVALATKLEICFDAPYHLV